MKLPLVSRAKYEEQCEVSDDLAVVITKLETERDELRRLIERLECPAEATKRAIFEVEGRIKVAELEAQLAKIREQAEQPAQEGVSRPSIKRVLSVAAQERKKLTK